MQEINLIWVLSPLWIGVLFMTVVALSWGVSWVFSTVCERCEGAKFRKKYKSIN